jgi:hypothetical protein
LLSVAGIGPKFASKLAVCIEEIGRPGAKNGEA